MNHQPNQEKGPGLGASAEPMAPNTTGGSHTDEGPSPPPYAPSSAGAPSASGPMHTGATATSDQFPTVLSDLPSPPAGRSSQPQNYPPGQRKPVPAPAGVNGAPDYLSQPQHSYSSDDKKNPFGPGGPGPDHKQDPFASPQPGYSQPNYNQPGQHPGYNTGSHYESNLSSPHPPNSYNPGSHYESNFSSPPPPNGAAPAGYPPSYPPTTSEGPSFFSPDDVGTSHTSPSPAYTTPLVVRPIAIPQTSLQPTAPLLQAFPPQLLSKGIPKDRWLSFVASLSGILSATDAENSKAHRSDIGREMANVPVGFGKSVGNHAVQIGRDLKKNARKGNLLGVTGTIIGGAVAWPVATSLKAVGAVLTLPTETMKAVAKKPQKRHERAAVAAAEASKGWLHERGFHASLMSTEELATVTGVEVRRFVDAGRGGPEDAGEKMRMMVDRCELADLEVNKGLGELEVGPATLWLVLVPYVPETVA